MGKKVSYIRVTGGPIQVNTYILKAEDEPECILIDPGAEFVKVERALQGLTVSAVCLTHGHYDHILYANEWLAKGAKLYVHEEDVPMIEDPRLNLSAVYNQEIALRKPDAALTEGSIIETAGLKLEVLHTPGHTPGSICFLCGDLLFSGDTLFHCGYGRTDLPGGNDYQLQNSLYRLLRMDPGYTVLPGHGEETQIGRELRYYR